jgi:CRISPR-associated protein Csm3
MNNKWKFHGKYVIEGVIHCVTGLHIGGNTEGFEIGGVDNPVMHDPLTDQPYIPGSSLKGKLRHLLEWRLGKVKLHPKHRDTYGPCECGKCAACVVFGPATDVRDKRLAAGPTRLSVRDAFLTEDSAQQLQQWLGEGLYTEVKTENALDRVTSEANPRPMERVPAGAKFGFTLIFDVYRDDDRKLLKDLFSAMAMLEDSALGGSGSRGHGQVEFRGLKAEWRSLEYYTEDKAAHVIAAVEGKGVKAIAGSFREADWKV